MKYLKIFTILLLSSVISFYACNDKADESKQEVRESLEVSDSPVLPNPATVKPASSEPAQNAEGVWHYTCNKGCDGGAGAASTCANCGGPLAHNKAYHGKANKAPIATPTTPSKAPTATPPAVLPAQNTTGVWHYTCGKGCAGGAGAVGTCGTCGGALAHNTVYHQ